VCDDKNRMSQTEVEIVADELQLILSFVDNQLDRLDWDLSKLETWKGDLSRQVSMSRALPFPETQKKADENEQKLAVFDAYLGLARARVAIRRFEQEKSKSDGLDQLRALGLA